MNIELYGRPGEKNTELCRKLFNEKKLTFFFHDLQNSSTAKLHMRKRLQGRTKIPQVVIDGKLVGNFDKTQKFFEEMDKAEANGQ